MIRNKLEKNDNVEVNTYQMEILKDKFAGFFDKEGNFQLDKFKTLLEQNEVEITKEGHELNFLGKSYARLQTGLETKTVITPNLEHNNKPENKDSKNIYITGDNWDALKHLLKSYSNEIKCIYIDPPYNTGNNDFIYPDNFEFTAHDLSDIMGVELEEADRILNMKGTSTHSAWMTFMFPRLFLARDLLKDDGVIFISIDDNEQANLKLMCDDIFGESNFINQISVKTKPSSGASGGGEDKKLKKNIEYILCYVKNNEAFEKFNDVYEEEDLFELIESMKEEGKSWKYTRVLYSLGEKTFFKDIKDGKDEDIRIYKHENVVFKTINELATELTKKEDISFEEAVRKVHFEYFDRIFRDTNAQSSIRTRVLEATDNEDTFYSIEYYPQTGRNKGKLTTLYYKGRNKDLIAWLKDVAYKTDTNIYKKEKLGTLWSNFNWNNVSKEGDVKYPNGKKPVALINQLLDMCTNDEDEDIVLDFFAGSSSTAHSVLDRNANAGNGNRRFIMVQLPEDLDKMLEKSSSTSKKDIQGLIDLLDSINKPHFLSEVGIERIKRSAQKLKEQTNADIDYGFKIYDLNTPSQNTLDKVIDFDPVAQIVTEDVLKHFEFHGVDGVETILQTWKVEDKFDFNYEHKELLINDYLAYLCEDVLYMINSGIKTNDIVKLVELIENGELNISKIILFPYSFRYIQLEEINRNLKLLKNTNSIKIVERY